MSTPSPWDHLKGITPEMLDGAIDAIRHAGEEVAKIKATSVTVQRGWLERLERFVLNAQHNSGCPAWWAGPCSCELSELQEDIIAENALDGFNREES